MLTAISEKLALSSGGHRCRPGARRSESAGDRVTFEVAFACAGPVRELAIRDDLFDVLGVDHHTLARIEAPGHAGQFAFATESRATRVTLGDGGASGLASFAWLGVEHILTGWDHLVFLLALLLPGGGLVAVVKIVTAFTIAHSVTLSLAVLNVVALPDRLVEAAIALSIAAVALENLLFSPAVTRRWLVSFGFGLVHGFGFSSVLREIGLPSDAVVVSLLGFNAGVEAGQLVVVAVALPLLAAVRNTGHEKRMVWACSVAILAVGVALFVDRALL
jgi:hypothetical protein